MSLPSEITTLINQLNQELDQTEQEAREELNLVLGEIIEAKIRGKSIISRLLDLL